MILECISHCFENFKEYLPGIKVFQKYLNSTVASLRGLSFKVLRKAQDSGIESIVFENWCDTTVENIEKRVNALVKYDLDLLQVWAEVQYVFPDILKERSQEQWR